MDPLLRALLVTILRNQLAILKAVKPQPGIAAPHPGHDQAERIRITEELLDGEPPDPRKLSPPDANRGPRS